MPSPLRPPAALLTLALLLGLLLPLQGCKPDNTAQAPPAVVEDVPASARPMAEDATIEVQVQQTGAGKFSFLGTSNLPDGAELLFRISSPLEGDRSRTKGETQASVAGRQFSTETFSQRGNPYESGTYDLSISLSQARVQPESVQQVIGDRGQYLRGPLVVPPDPSDALAEYGPILRVEKKLRIAANGNVSLL